LVSVVQSFVAAAAVDAVATTAPPAITARALLLDVFLSIGTEPPGVCIEGQSQNGAARNYLKTSQIEDHTMKCNGLARDM
jgi:hypothetical protein